MKIQRITIRNSRAIEDISLKCSPCIDIIYDENGAEKGSILDMLTSGLAESVRAGRGGHRGHVGSCCGQCCQAHLFAPARSIVQVPLARGKHHNVRNTHIEPQSKAPDRVLDYGNLCASCDGSLNRMRSSDIRKGAHCDLRQGEALLCLSRPQGTKKSPCL